MENLADHIKTTPKTAQSHLWLRLQRSPIRITRRNGSLPVSSAAMGPTHVHGQIGPARYAAPASFRVSLAGRPACSGNGKRRLADVLAVASISRFYGRADFKQNIKPCFSLRILFPDCKGTLIGDHGNRTILPIVSRCFVIARARTALPNDVVITSVIDYELVLLGPGSEGLHRPKKQECRQASVSQTCTKRCIL